ncbi:MAG: polymer-forming cytoskeletal protein [Myxococcota bacterium]
MSTPEITTILGPGSAFEGKLTFEGAVRIDGDFKGEIRTDGTLIIGEAATVQAEIAGAQVVIHGTVRGNVQASVLVEIHAPGRVYGNVATPSLEVEKGSLFEGNCTMQGDAQEPAADDETETPAPAEPSGSDAG